MAENAHNVSVLGQKRSGDRRSRLINHKIILVPFTFTISLIWLWPFRPLPLNGFYQEVLAFSAALILLIVLLFMSKTIRVQRNVFCFLVLAVLPLLQSLQGVIQLSGNAWLVSIYLASFALMLMVGNNIAIALMPSSGKNFGPTYLIASLAGVFVLAATLSTWIALRQYFHLADSIWEINQNSGRPYANLAQPNNLATLLGLGLAGCLYFYEKQLLGGLAAGALSFFLLLGLAVTQSRTPWVTSLVILAFWLIKIGDFSPRLRFSSLCAWVVFYALLVLIVPNLSNVLELGGASFAERAAAAGRWALWQQLWFAVSSGPFWGYGWNQTAAAQISVMLDWPLAMMATHSHNLVLDLLLWNGLVPGSLIVILIAVWLARLGWFANSKESLFALIAAGFILTHSMFEYPFAYAYFLLPLGLLLGIASADLPEKSHIMLPRIILLVVVVLGGGLLKVVIMDYQIIKADYQAQRMQAAKVIGFEAEVPITDVIILTQFRELQRFRAALPEGGVSEERLYWMQSVVHQYPHLANLYRYSLILRLNGQEEDSERYLTILCHLHGPVFCEQARREMVGVVTTDR